jgi:hypothetical protein
MTKSEAEPANEFVQNFAEGIRERLLPEKGAEFQITYFAGEAPVQYGKEPYTWVNAVSDGLRVVCDGPEYRVSHSRQRKPMIPSMFFGEDGSYRRMLRIAINGDEVGNNADYYVHILGNLVVVSKEKLNCAQVVRDQSLTDKDRAIMDRLRKANK